MTGTLSSAADGLLKVLCHITVRLSPEGRPQRLKAYFLGRFVARLKAVRFHGTIRAVAMRAALPRSYSHFWRTPGPGTELPGRAL